MILTVSEIYAIFADESNEIFGFQSMKKFHKCTKKEIATMKQQFHSQYDRETHEIYKIISNKKHRHIGRINSVRLAGQQIAPNSQEQRTASLRKFWEDNKNTEYGKYLREIRKKSMLEVVASGATTTPEVNKKRAESRMKNNPLPMSTEVREKIAMSNTGQTRTAEARHNMSEAAINKFANGYVRPPYVVSDANKLLLSAHTKKMWIDGRFTVNGHLFNSKGQRDLTRIICEYIFPEVDIGANVLRFGKSWDVLIDKFNIIIEYNGTYWHYDPRFYQIDYYDKFRSVTVSDVWNKDIEKSNIACDNGYKFYTIWQHDWELLKDDSEKIIYIQKILSC